MDTPTLYPPVVPNGTSAVPPPAAPKMPSLEDYPALILEANQRLRLAQEQNRAADARIEQLKTHFNGQAAQDETLKNETTRKAYVQEQMAKQVGAHEEVQSSERALWQAETQLSFLRHSFEVAKLLLEREIAAHR